MRQHTWQHGERSQPDEDDALRTVHRTLGWIPPIVVRSAGRKGKGAFAARQLRALEVIGEYSGEILRAQLSWEECRYTFQLYCGGLVVDAARCGNMTRFINHARPPRSNTIAAIAVANGVRKVVLRASRDIDSGDELLLDYGYDRDGWISL
jgi:SET domain-containing protein